MQAFLKGGTISKAKPDKSSESHSAEKGKKKLVPWVEKYRPRSVNDVAYQDEVVAVLQKSLQGADLPNLLFYGPPGTGKTSTILAVARDLFGDMFRERVLELNASDERGINIVRKKVKNFSQLAASSTRSDGRSCPPFRIVILDEADSMTNAAQSALRRTMERETKTTRFCLICNYVTRIIEPITSRCAKFRFKPLSMGILAERLKGICEQESISLDDEVLQTLLASCEGDLRKAITYLQSVSRLRGSEKVRQEDIFEVAGLIEEDVIESLLNVCQSNSYEKLEIAINDLIADGQSAGQVITQIHDKIVQSEQLNDKQKSAICERLAIVDKCLMDGADEYLQIMDLCTVIMQQASQAN